MTRIPRLDPSVPAAGIPSSNPSAATGGAEGTSDAFGKLADVGYKVAADQEKVLAAHEQAKLEAKQAVVNEVDAGRRAGDYEEALTGHIEDLKTQYADAPDKAPGELLTIGRQLQNQMQEQAPNSAVGLAVAQRANARLDAAVKEMHAWALLRQTQKAKGDLQITINRATAGAESVGSTETLGAYIKSKEAELGPVFQKVLGPVDATTVMKGMREDMARSWVLASGDKNPIGVLQALDEKKGPLVDYLDVSHREALKKETVSAFEGLTKTRELDSIKKGMADNKTLFQSFSAGDPNLGMAMEAQRKSLEEQKAAAKAQISVDSSVLKKLGIDVAGQSSGDIVKAIDARLEFVNALNHARRRQLPFDAEDDPATVVGQMYGINKAINAKTGKDLGLILQQESLLAGAINDKKISGSTAQTLFKTMALALDTAAANNENVNGPNTWRIFHAPLQYGVVELNRQFDGLHRAMEHPAQVQARVRYLSSFNAAQEAGNKVTKDQAKEMALEAIQVIEAQEAERKKGK